MKIETEKWKYFQIGGPNGIFHLKKGYYNKKPEHTLPGQIPFIGAVSSNNGVTEYYSMEDIAHTHKDGSDKYDPVEKKMFDGNCIVVTNNGSVGHAFYQRERFTCSHDVNPLYLKDRPMNVHLAMFLCTIIEKERYRWAYGRKWRPERMENSFIKLPANEAGEPDFPFMEDFIKSLHYKPVTTAVKAKECRPDVSQWKDYAMDSLFRFEKGKRLTKADMVPGNANYLGAISENNGIREKIEADFLWKPNCITVNYNGSVGEAFYQSEPFWASDDVNVLYAKDFWEMNKYAAMFLITVIKANKYRFGYGRKWTIEKMKETMIKLPAKADQTPDFAYMEHYIKSLPYSDRI